MGQNTSARGHVQAALAMTAVGTLTAVSAVISGYPVYGGQAVRYAVAALILFAVARVQDRAAARRPGGAARAAARTRPAGREWPLVVALAATGLAGFNVCIVEGTRYTGPATIGTVVGTVPIVLAVVVPLMDGRRPSPRLIAAALIVAAGTGLADGVGGGSLPGLLLSLGALAGEVGFSLLAIPLLPRLGAVRVSAYAAATAAPMLLLTGLAVDGTGVLRMPTPAEAAGLGYLCVVVTAGAFLVWYDALGRIGADRAGLFAGLIPVSAAVTTMMLGLPAPGSAQIAGTLLVGCGVVTGLARSADRPLAADVAEHEHEQAHHDRDDDDQARDGDDRVEQPGVVRRRAQQDV